MKLINLTPHEITIRVSGNGVNHGQDLDVTIPSSGVARLEESSEQDLDGAIDVDGWPDGGLFTVQRREFGDIAVRYPNSPLPANYAMPDPQEGVLYVVSMPVAQRAAEMGRTDVYAPDTGSTAVRWTSQDMDDAFDFAPGSVNPDNVKVGRIRAVRGLVRFDTPHQPKGE